MENKFPTVEYFDDRFYKVITTKGEEYYPSTTTKLNIISKPFLYRYYGELGWEQASRKLKESQDKGIREHYAFHILCKGGIVVFNDYQHPSFSHDEIEELKKKNKYFCIIESQVEMVDVWKIVRFFDIVKPRLIETECTVYSHKHREAGTLDALLDIKPGEYIVSGSEPTIFEGGLYITDLKTGNEFTDEAYLQMSDYAMMYEEMYPDVKIAGVLGIHTNSKSRKGVEGLSLYVKHRKEMLIDYQDYRKASDLWCRKNKDMKPRNFDFPSILKIGL